MVEYSICNGKVVGSSPTVSLLNITMMYPLYELEQLEKWLEMKIQSLEAAGGNPLEYSEVNLTKSILKFVKFMSSEQRNKQLDHSAALYEYGISPYGVPSPATRYGSNTATPVTQTICAHCKTMYPQQTHCVHCASSVSTSTKTSV